MFVPFFIFELRDKLIALWVGVTNSVVLCVFTGIRWGGKGVTGYRWPVKYFIFCLFVLLPEWRIAAFMYCLVLVHKLPRWEAMGRDNRRKRAEGMGELTSFYLFWFIVIFHRLMLFNIFYSADSAMITLLVKPPTHGWEGGDSRVSQTNSNES